MKLKGFVSKDAINNLSRLNGRLSSLKFIQHCSFTLVHQKVMAFTGYIHSTRETKLTSSSVGPDTDVEEEDESINEFLSRFVWIMRKKMAEAY